jgi:acyl-CoA oxidase
MDLLLAERSQASFDVLSLTHLLNGEKVTETKKRSAQILRSDSVLQRLRDREPFTNKTEKMLDMMEKTKRMHEIVDEHFPELNGSIPRFAAKSGFSFDYAFPPFNNTLLSGANSMFIGVIRSQMSAEQQKVWLGPALKRKITGTYAQTELGHGSNVRGLETTAAFDVISQEFVIHSPTISSTKWWPAHLGFGCTHAIVYARLLLGEQGQSTDHGVHPFMVQLRDLSTYLPLPGVTLGTSGPTIGHYANEHGRCRFERLRIPRANMCMRWNQVTAAGEFVAAPRTAQKASYITMTQVQSQSCCCGHPHQVPATSVFIFFFARFCYRHAWVSSPLHSAISRRLSRSQCDTVQYASKAILPRGCRRPPSSTTVCSSTCS